jgi:hypothetical protein
LIQRSPISRTLVNLSPSFDQRLKAYCIAAGTAGVSMLALNSAANAEVVYTPSYGHIAFERWSKIDFNHDGIPDVSFFLSSSNYKVIDRALAGRPSPGGGIIGYKGQFFSYASAFKAGAVIGSKGNFIGAEPLLCRTEINHYDGYSTFSAGAWRNSRGRYLGVRFLINGEIHYGWIRLSVSAPRKLEAVVTGYAYETVANQPIRAGQTSGEFSGSTQETGERPVDSAPIQSLGILALGANGRGVQ